MISYEMLDKFEIDITKVFVQFKCRKCNRTWGINLQNFGDSLPENYGVCINCSAKEIIRKVSEKEKMK